MSIRQRSYMGLRSIAFASALLFGVAFVMGQSMMQASPAQSAQSAPQQASPQAANQVSLNGVIAQISASTLFITTSTGTVVPVAIGKDSLILSRKITTLDSIRPGEALGVAAMKAADGSLTATSINVFPAELWQRVRKGQFPMPNGQIMTNAQVDRLATQVQGRVIFLKYEMLTAAIVVPDNAELHRSVILGLGDLRIGMTVSARGVAGADGIVAASTVNLDSAPGT